MSKSGRSRGMTAVFSVLDVVVAFVWLGLAAATTMLPGGSPVRVFAALTTLLILPGYALTTAIYPASTSSGATKGKAGEFEDSRTPALFDSEGSSAAISDVERGALSFGLSLASLPLLGLLADLTFASYDLVPMLTVLTGFLAVVFLVGVFRRFGVPENERYVLPVGNWIAVLAESFGRTDGLDRLLNVSLAIVVVVSMGMVGVALVAPQEGEGYTEAAILAKQPDGEWSAKNYPTEMESGEEVPMMVAVTNEEREPVEYTVVVLLQRVDEDGTVVEYRELNRFSNRVAPGETWRNPHVVTPRRPGTKLRLTYLVYRGEPPATPSTATAYRHVGYTINVTA